MIMELAQDGTLFNQIKRKSKLSEEEVSQYMDQISSAIAYLHDLTPPVLHRDLKPENILLSKNDVKICDFGWSNTDNQDEIRNTFCGTPDYLSPEMITGIGHNEKLDVWTIGVLMYEMLCGKPPFTPPKGIKDRRLKQKIIEDNVLKGKIEFPDFLSSDAKSAIKILLDPNPNLRPYAKDIKNLTFFQKFKSIQSILLSPKNQS